MGKYTKEQLVGEYINSKPRKTLLNYVKVAWILHIVLITQEVIFYEEEVDWAVWICKHDFLF